MTIAEALRTTRNESKKSQEFMALELQVSRRTIQHWETGVSEPSIGQAIQWFRLVNKNPVPYLLQYMFPEMGDIGANNEVEKIKQSLLMLINELQPESIRQLMYLFYGDHGSSPHAVLQMLTAHLQTPMRDRVTTAGVILKNYEIAQKKGTLTKPDQVQPDLHILRIALHEGEQAFLNDANEYSI